MKSLGIFALSCCFLLAAVTEAGSFADFLNIASGTLLTGGLNVPYKALGVVRRCRNQPKKELCERSDGCYWNIKEEGMGRCRALGFLGLRQFYVNQNEEYTF
jgi:hypothetical protein